jgi:hypothetical protein
MMNDPIAFGGFCSFIVLLVFGAYQCGFARGLAHGFKAGFKSADNFARLKRSEKTPQHNGNIRI